MSDSTEAYDRGAKSSHYRRLPSLKEFFLIAQDQPLVERYVRQPDGSWVLRDATRLDETVVLDGIPVELPLSEICRQVTVPEQLSPPADSAQSNSGGTRP